MPSYKHFEGVNEKMDFETAADFLITVHSSLKSYAYHKKEIGLVQHVWLYN